MSSDLPEDRLDEHLKTMNLLSLLDIAQKQVSDRKYAQAEQNIDLIKVVLHQINENIRRDEEVRSRGPIVNEFGGRA